MSSTSWGCTLLKPAVLLAVSVAAAIRRSRYTQGLREKFDVVRVRTLGSADLGCAIDRDLHLQCSGHAAAR